MCELKRRLGLFLSILGAFIVVLFLTSDAAGQTNFWLLVVGIPTLLLGMRIMRRTQPPRQPSQRFRLLRWVLGGFKKQEPPDQNSG